MTERVLVLPRTAIPGDCDFHGIRGADDGMLAALRAAVGTEGRYLDRATAETDPAHKQLIPYVFIRSGPEIFLMRRTDAGGDARLYGKASIGVGGHVNPVDDGGDPLMTGLRREWSEELEAAWEPEFELLGLLNDDTNPVGAVHLGIVFGSEARGRRLDVREHDKLVGGFANRAQLLETWDRLETWSQLVARAIGFAPSGC
ncbi:MAG: phosphoesterase [Candidatus Limnocylindria bacterium]